MKARTATLAALGAALLIHPMSAAHAAPAAGSSAAGPAGSSIVSSEFLVHRALTAIKFGPTSLPQATACLEQVTAADPGRLAAPNGTSRRLADPCSTEPITLIEYGASFVTLQLGGLLAVPGMLASFAQAGSSRSA